MGRKPTGNPRGRPKKKASAIPTGIAWEMQNVPHQSDLHHCLYNIAGSFEAGPEWFKSVEQPLIDILGQPMAERIRQAQWHPDGQDFYALIERWIQSSALSEKKGNESQFMSSVVRSCARGFVSKFHSVLNQTDVGDIVGRAFEKIIVSGKYDPSIMKAEKLSYLKRTTYSAGYDLLRERAPNDLKREEKDLTVRSNPRNIPPNKPYTLEDMLADLNMILPAGKAAKKSA